MKQNNVYLLITCTLFATSTLFPSKKRLEELPEILPTQERRFEVQKKGLLSLPPEVLENIVGYTELETQEALVKTSTYLQQLSIPELFDRLVRYNIINKSNFAIPRLSEYYELIAQRRFHFPLINLLVKLYVKPEGETVIFHDIAFRDEYKAAIARNINFFLNSELFFNMITLPEVNQITHMELKKNFGIDMFHSTMKDVNTKTINRFVTIQNQKTGTKKTLTFLVTDTFINANNLLSQVSTQGITKIFVRQTWKDIGGNINNVLSNIQNYFIPIVDKNNTSLLSAACDMKDLNVIDFCLKHEVSWHPDIFGNNPVHYATIFSVNSDQLDEFYDEIVSLVHVYNDFEAKFNQVLQLLARDERLVLLQKNINKKNHDGVAPLELAITQAIASYTGGNINNNVLLNVLDPLLKYGADPNQRSSVYFDEVSLLSYLVILFSRTYNMTQTEAEQERLKLLKFIELLLKYGANPHQDESETTSYHQARQRGFTEIVKLFDKYIEQQEGIMILSPDTQEEETSEE